MHLLGRTLLLAALSIIPAWALHQSEAGVVDWHNKLIGIPLSASLSTAPVFHRVGGVNESTRSIVLTATQSNVLAALDPVDGSVAWRHVFEAKDPIAFFRKHNNVVATLSGPGGSTLRSFGALTGHLLFEKRLHSPETGTLFEPEDIGVSIAFAPQDSSTTKANTQMLVLTSGHTLRSIDSTTGETKWSWTTEDQGSLIIYSKIMITPSTTYLIGVAKSFKSFTLHVTALSTASGTLLASQNIPSSLTPSSSSTLFLSLTNNSDPSPTPRLVWLESGSLRSFALNPKLTGKPGGYKGVAYSELVDIGLGGHGLCVAIKADGAGKVVRLDNDEGGLKAIWEFQDSAGSTRLSPSIYTGGFDKEGWPYVSRIFWSHVLKKASVHTYAAHLADGRGLVTGITVPFDTGMHGIISHATIDTANPTDYTVLTRAVFTTTTGAVQLWQQDKEQWTREEALADIAVAEFVELPEMKVAELHRGDETFGHRTLRQLKDAQDFPRYLVNFIKRFATGSYASVSSSVSSSGSPNSNSPLSRDAFGFRQVIVAATSHGKVYGIDSSNGAILWSRVLGLGWAGEVGAKVLPVKMFVIKTVGDEDGEGPQVVLVTQRKADNTLVDTVLFHIDAMTGEDARKTSPSPEIFQGLDIISGPIVEAFLFQNNTKTVLLLDEFMQVHLYPDTPENKADFHLAVPSLHFAVRTGRNGPGKRQQLMGHQFILNPDLSPLYVGYPTWTISLPPNEEIQSIIPSTRGPVASVGKVLGNRTTLYKYLNPHLTTLITSSSSPTPTCTIYLIDATKGNIVYHATLPASSTGVCDIKAIVTENWLVYQYFDENFEGVGQSKGHRVVSVEFYEGVKVDDKTKSSDMSSFSNKTIDVTAYEQSWIVPYGVTALATTSTKFGVTAKDIIFATKNSQIQSVPRRLLDPRRPNRKVTNQEAEEQLMQYEPVLASQPQRVLSHNYEVANAKRILTAPALLESTSLIFVYGLDLFLTRVAPSGTFDVLSEDFNKVQLVLTIIGLAVAIIVTKPMVQQKRLRERWYQ